MAEIQLRNLSKSWGNFVAVKDFNLTIADKEFLVLLGPSGCGKTTTMRMIAGLEDVSEGEIFIDGKLVNNLEPKDRDISMVFQSYALYPNMNVYDNIRFPLKVRKINKSTQDSKVKKAAQMVELTDYLNRKPAELSGGQKQRVALARAIVREPNVFLMDEPLSNLDAKLRNQMRLEIKKLQRQMAVTSIFVTHDQTEAMTLGDRIVVINNGVVEQVGTPKEIYSKPNTKFVAEFIGSPQMNLFNCKIDNGTATINNNSINLNKSITLEDASVGIRPDDIQISDSGSISCKANLVEYLGSDMIIYSSIGDQEFSCKLSSKIDVKAGDEFKFDVEPSLVHIFDNSSGKRLD